MRLRRAARAAVLSVAAFVLAIGVIFVLTQGVARPQLWEIPLGYQGWVLMQYGDLSCPRTESQGIFEVIRVAADGRGCTSSDIPRGWFYGRYEYVTNESRLPIDGHMVNSGHVNWGASRIAFFIGPAEKVDPSTLPPDWR